MPSSSRAIIVECAESLRYASIEIVERISSLLKEKKPHKNTVKQVTVKMRIESD